MQSLRKVLKWIWRKLGAWSLIIVAGVGLLLRFLFTRSPRRSSLRAAGGSGMDGLTAVEAKKEREHVARELEVDVDAIDEKYDSIDEAIRAKFGRDQ